MQVASQASYRLKKTLQENPLIFLQHSWTAAYVYTCVSINLLYPTWNMTSQTNQLEVIYTYLTTLFTLLYF